MPQMPPADRTLDPKILALIKDRINTQSDITNKVGNPKTEGDTRQVDRALQRLRRRGAIEYDKKSRTWKPSIPKASASKHKLK